MLSVLLLSYGTPSKLGEVEAYLTHIRHGREPTPEMVEHLMQRYLAIGGRSPLLEIAEKQATALEQELANEGIQATVHPAMKHWHPFIADVIREAYHRGSRDIMAIPLAPHYSSIGIEGYKAEVEESVKQLGGHVNIRLVESWHLNPELLHTWKGLIQDSLAEGGEDAFVLFTAHSIPQKYVVAGDPYSRQLLETSNALARTLSLERWDLAYQSASQTGEPWLGPDLAEKMTDLAKTGVKSVLIAPIGFVTDHLEILYDIDVEAARKANRVGILLRRTRMPNSEPSFISALSSLVKETL